VETQLVLSAALIIVTMVILDWRESRRSRVARAYPRRRDQRLSATPSRNFRGDVQHGITAPTTSQRRTA